MIRDREYTSAVEVSKMKRLMQYDHAAQIEDWNTLVACAQLQIDEDKPHLAAVMDSCMDRILAWQSATGDVPWNIEGRDF